MKRMVPVHRGLGELQRAPSRVTQFDSRSDELKRRVTTATPVRSAMEQGKEPSQRSFELTTQECVRQEDRHEFPVIRRRFCVASPRGMLIAWAADGPKPIHRTALPSVRTDCRSGTEFFSLAV
jgi:hypothetical protein